MPQPVLTGFGFSDGETECGESVDTERAECSSDEGHKATQISDTVGCTSFKIFAVPGVRESVHRYSRQYEKSGHRETDAERGRVSVAIL